MASAKTWRLLSSLLVAAVWLGALIFGGGFVRPLLKDVMGLSERVATADALIQQRIEADLIPSEGLIGRFEQFKRQMIKEAEICAWEFLLHNKCLDKKILESWRPDPYEVGMNFREVKEQLANKAGHPDFLELGTLDDWEQEDSEAGRGRPRKEDFAALEKRTCIAAVLVDILTTDPATVIELMKVQDPLPPRDAPPLPAADWLVVRHRTYPVEVQFTTHFESLGRLLNLIVTTPPGSADTPCMALRQINMRSTDPRGGSTVQVNLTLDVYDFHQVKDSS